MGLVDMKRAEEMGSPVEVSKKSNTIKVYPYGFQITLRDADIKKLGKVFDNNVGDDVTFVAVGTVTKKSEDAESYEPGRSMTIQLKRVAIKPYVKKDEGIGSFMKKERTK